MKRPLGPWPITTPSSKVISAGRTKQEQNKREAHGQDLYHVMELGQDWSTNLPSPPPARRHPTSPLRLQNDRSSRARCASLSVQVGDGGFPAGAREGREGRWRPRRRDRCVRAAGKQGEAEVAAAAAAAAAADER